MTLSSFVKPRYGHGDRLQDEQHFVELTRLSDRLPLAQTLTRCGLKFAGVHDQSTEVVASEVLRCGESVSTSWTLPTSSGSIHVDQQLAWPPGQCTSRRSF